MQPGVSKSLTRSAAEEIVKVSAYLASLPQIDLAKTNSGEGLTGFGVAMAKLQLIAEPETVGLISELSSKYGELYFKLLVKVQPIYSLQTDIDIADDLHKQARSEVTPRRPPKLPHLWPPQTPPP